MAINTEAPRVLAEEAKRTRALLVHYSPDYVFDGTKRQPWVEADSRHPFNVYGKTSWQKKPFKRWAEDPEAETLQTPPLNDSIHLLETSHSQCCIPSPRMTLIIVMQMI